MGIVYITYNQLMDDVRSNLYKIPKETDLILAVPRSGTIVAAIIAKYLNCHMMMVQDFCDVIQNGGGDKELKEKCHKGLSIVANKPFKNILVIDDTIYSGRQMNVWRQELAKDIYKDFKFLFMAAYKEGPGNPDFYLRDISYVCLTSVFKSAIYEWTLWYRYDIGQHIAYDLDGVFCLDPPDDHNTEVYENYLKNPIKYYFPLQANTYYKTTVITYRIEKYRELTANFLRSIRVWCTLYMVKANSRYMVVGMICTCMLSQMITKHR